MDSGDSSPIAVADDFISNEDILVALQHLDLTDDGQLFLTSYSSNSDYEDIATSTTLPLDWQFTTTTQTTGRDQEEDTTNSLPFEDDLIHIFDNDDDDDVGLIRFNNNHKEEETPPNQDQPGSPPGRLDPSSLEPEFETDLAAKFDSLALDDESNDEFLFSAWNHVMMEEDVEDAASTQTEALYCQPCNDPNAIPPSPFTMLTSDAFSIAAALLVEEYNAAARENDAFWKEQLQVLEPADSDAYCDIPPSNETWDLEPIPLEKTNTLDESSNPEQQQPQHQDEFIPKPPRPEAIALAQPYISAFSSTLWPEQHVSGRRKQQPKLRECLGHRERILGCSISPNGKMLATASQDGTVRIWNTKSHQQIRVLQAPDNSHEEVLRVAWHNQEYLAAGGADGWVHIYRVGSDGARSDEDWALVTSIDHGLFLKPVEPSSATATTTAKLEAIAEDDKEGKDEDSDDKEENGQVGPPQIYALQFIKEWKALSKLEDSTLESVFLLTSADDFVILWEVCESNTPRTETGSSTQPKIQPREIFSLQFTEITATGYGVSLCNISEGNVNLRDNRGSIVDPSTVFGGNIRNPNNIIFVFDASYCVTNGLIGAALSDGSLRLMNSRGVCLSVLSLPGCQSHLTSFSWDSTGQKLATAVATGHVIVWNVEQFPGEKLWRSCHAVYQGGHIPGRPVFGARYMANDELIITWGSDCRLCLWDGKAADEIDSPLSILLEKEDYPIYGVDVFTDMNDHEDSSAILAVAGGGAMGGIVGIPVYLQDITGIGRFEEESTAKRTKVAKT